MARTPAKPAAPKPPKDDTQDRKLVTVTGPRRGRWRAGRRFTDRPVSIPAEELSKAELAALQDDPKLSVSLGDPSEDTP